MRSVFRFKAIWMLVMVLLPLFCFAFASSMNCPGGNEFKREGNEQGVSLLSDTKPYREVKLTEGRKRLSQDLDQIPVPCDTAASYLDFAVIDARKHEGTYLIIIARPGTGENLKNLSQRRLSVVEEYVLRRGKDLKYVLAEGRQVKGLGRIELYVGGELARVLPFEKNASGYCLPGREGW
jgi:hypothetical protein